MAKFKKIFVQILILALAVGMINIATSGNFSIFNQGVSAETLQSSTDNETLQEAMDNIDIYSSYKYQTLTDAKLQQLSTDFYLPASYQDILITWEVNNTRIDIASVSEAISISTTTGPVTIFVYKATITSLPSAIAGNDPFSLTATFTDGENTSTLTITGELIPTMPDDFWGGVFFTLFRYLSLFVEGVLTTLLLSLAGTVIGFFLAMVLVLMRLNTRARHEKKWISYLRKFFQTFAKVYVTVFRGTPMIVQAAFFWYGLGLFGDAMLCGLFVVSLNTTAYIAEILRGGINSIDSGQTEAARSLGLSSIQTMRYVIFPQAIKNSMPAIGNEFVINIKDTSVLSIIGIFELFNQTQKIAGMHYRQLEAYFVVALIYLFLTYSVTKILQHIEKKLDMPIKELTSSN